MVTGFIPTALSKLFAFGSNDPRKWILNQKSECPVCKKPLVDGTNSAEKQQRESLFENRDQFQAAVTKPLEEFLPDANLSRADIPSLSKKLLSSNLNHSRQHQGLQLGSTSKFWLF